MEGKMDHKLAPADHFFVCRRPLDSLPLVPGVDAVRHGRLLAAALRQAEEPVRQPQEEARLQLRVQVHEGRVASRAEKGIVTASARSQVQRCEEKVSEKCHTDYETRCETYHGKEM